MNQKKYESWKREEQEPFSGWDFAYLEGRLLEEDAPPGNYMSMARELLVGSAAALDIGTGGGERLAQLGPLPARIAATEGYPPNFSESKKRLEPLGVEVVQASEGESLPFPSSHFDLVLDRHAAFDPQEVMRVLTPGGTFLTQQVGSDNLADLKAEFGVEPEADEWTLAIAKDQIKSVGLIVNHEDAWVGRARIKDIGALVYFLKAIPWIVPGFSVDRDLEILERLETRLEKGVSLEYMETRFILRATKLA